MIDPVGKFLLGWRLKVVLPEIRGQLLDVGCGTNELVRRYNAARRCRCGTGVDVYPWPNVDLVVDDTASLPWDDEAFDTVTIVAALNHIPNREEVLREAYRLLCPQGRLIVTMIPPGLSRVWHRLRRSADADQSQRGMKPGEVFGLTRRDVRRLLLKAGFASIRQRRFMLGVNCVTVGEKPAQGPPTPAQPATAAVDTQAQAGR